MANCRNLPVRTATRYITRIIGFTLIKYIASWYILHMNIMAVYGSPRHFGNSTFLGKEFIAEAIRRNPVATVTENELQKLHIGGCMGCDACRKNGGRCVQQDDMQPLYDQYVGADTLVYTTPVYWWGVSAQLKLFIDRLYALGTEPHKGKKLYLIAVGADEVEGVQYELIRKQFVEICDYCGIDFAGYLPVSADDDHPAKQNRQAVQAARTLYKA